MDGRGEPSDSPPVLAVAEERKELAKDNARLEAEVNQLRAANEKQAKRIKDLEYDVLECEDRVDDLCAQLREARERETKRARKVRVRAASILNLCADVLEEVSDEASCAGAGQEQQGQNPNPNLGNPDNHAESDDRALERFQKFAPPKFIGGPDPDVAERMDGRGEPSDSPPVLAVAEERKELAKDNARLEAEVNQLRAANEKQAKRIKDLEYDVLECEDRVDDLCAQLREARERETKRARKVRVRAASILNLCADVLEEVSDEASCAGAGAGVLAVAEERKELAKDNARLEAEVNQLRAANEKQAKRIKDLEYDVLECEDRVDDLCAQLREARERETKRARKVRVRAASILNLCADVLEEVSDEASCAGAGAGGASTPAGGSTSLTTD
ncbi:uncharacterized protein LOC113759908 [Coffea eugenioides]|uniref:uncharacterized protein LOC113759908 n=1 Tax=Coffea eugenioides TaxID=49369 RepID=UPI000F612483|nr:uncharacterized protein LOC113759908 [Coffea eugenioides]